MSKLEELEKQWRESIASSISKLEITNKEILNKVTELQIRFSKFNGEKDEERNRKITDLDKRFNDRFNKLEETVNLLNTFKIEIETSGKLKKSTFANILSVLAILIVIIFGILKLLT